MKYLLLLLLVICDLARAEVRWTGRDCQICTVNGNVEACRFHSPCPLRKESENNYLNRVDHHGRSCTITTQRNNVEVSQFHQRCPVKKD